MTAMAMNFPSGRDYPRGSVRRLVLNLINGFGEALDAARRYQTLAHKSDAELDALRIRREDLPRIAVSGHR